MTDETRGTFPIADLALDLITAADKGPPVHALADFFGRHGEAGVRAIVERDPTYLPGNNWIHLDTLYSKTRDLLRREQNWDHGPARIRYILGHYRNGLRHVRVAGASVVDLGCGDFQPYSIGTVFYLNGAARCGAVDVHRVPNPTLAAHRLRDLLVECLCYPAEWLMSGAVEEDFVRRVFDFDLAALSRGDLEAGLARVPLAYRVGRAEDVLAEFGGIDIMVSHTVLEHVRDLAGLIRSAGAAMAPGGVAYHIVDYTDHRYNLDRSKHYWSFMTEPGEQDLGINTLRHSEVTRLFEDAGFAVESEPATLLRATPPPEVLSGLVGRYRDLPREDFEVISAGLRVTRGRAGEP